MRIRTVVLGTAFAGLLASALCTRDSRGQSPDDDEIYWELQPQALRDAPCPFDMVFVTGMGVCIDRYEWPNKYCVRPKVDASGLREGHIKKDETHDADTLCKNVGKRVCQIEEWVAACRGPDNARYPWGNRTPRGKELRFENEGKLPCSFNKEYRPVSSETKVWKRDPEIMKHLDQSEPAGHRESCRSAVGAYDMTGNAEEWVRCPGVAKSGWCLMGRFWSQLYPCDKAVKGHHPRWHYYTTGFRCCADLEEGED